MRVGVLINPSSGARLGIDEPDGTIIDALRARGLDARAVPPGPGIVSRARHAAGMDVDAVVVGGGDGTIACAAQALIGTGKALGLLPMGTMNLLAKDLGIPIPTGAAMDALAGGRRAAIDVGQVYGSGEVNGHVFLCSSIMGLPARLARHRERDRGKGGLASALRFARASLNAVTRALPMRFTIRLPGETLHVRTGAMVIGDNALNADFGRERLDGGELALYVARRFQAWHLVRFGIGLGTGLADWRTDFDLHLAREFTVESRRRHLRVMNDGEVLLLKPPLTFRVRPLALEVIVPGAQGAAAGAAVAEPAGA